MSRLIAFSIIGGFITFLIYSIPAQADEIEPEPAEEPAPITEPEPEPEPEPVPVSPEQNWTAFQLAVFDPAQSFPEETDVYGLKLNIPYGRSTTVYGIDAGVVGYVGSMNGIQFDAFLSEAKDMNGIQLGGLPGNRAENLNGLEVGIVNTVEGRVNGIQLAPLLNHADDLIGMQVAGVRNRSTEVRGIQISPVVNDAESMTGLQVGILNFAERVIGVQIGPLINKADSVAGLQIGLLNINRGGWLPFFPIVNFGFGREGEEIVAGEN